MMRDGNRTRGVIVWRVLWRRVLDWRMWVNISIYISTFTDKRVVTFRVHMTTLLFQGTILW
jgi:hypothetical protein